jgi:PIN domain nuclease of toxin-antitoxin system
MTRFLICLSSDPIITGKNFVVSKPGLSKYEIMEGVTGMTPFGIQLSHVTQETAESLVHKYPGDWQIVNAADLEELERIWNASET